MAEAFIGEIKIVAFSYAPRYWALCNGQLLSTSQNQALFSLLGTAYGGNGMNTFALPNMQGNVPIHVGPGSGRGVVGGEQNHTLSITEIPTHTHTLSATTIPATTNTPTASLLLAASNPFEPLWPTQQSCSDASGCNPSVGGGQPHNNMQPFLTLNFCIALSGIFPSRN